MTDKNIIPAFNHLQNSDYLQAMQAATIKVMCAFNQDYQAFHASLSHRFVKELQKQLGKNVSAIRSKTGLTKTTVVKALNDQSKAPTFVEKQKTLLSSAFTEINSYCFNHKVDRMPTIEFYKIMQSYADGHISIRSRLDRLMETGLIAEDDQGIYLVFDKPVKKVSDDEYIKLISDGYNQLASTVIYNRNKPEHLSKLFQRQLRTNKIAPKKSIRIQEQINNLLAETLKQVNNLLVENEEDVPNGTYPEIVIQLLHYNENLTEEYNHEKK